MKLLFIYSAEIFGKCQLYVNFDFAHIHRTRKWSWRSAASNLLSNEIKMFLQQIKSCFDLIDDHSNLDWGEGNLSSRDVNLKVTQVKSLVDDLIWFYLAQASFINLV